MQIFTAGFGWSQSFPMLCMGSAHESLDLLFAREGVQPKIDYQWCKGDENGRFDRKCKEASYYLWGTEPYSPWSNSTESEIWELKKGAARKLTQSGAPRQLWCFALEYKSYVRLHTAHDIYQLDGSIPKMVVVRLQT